MHCPFCGHVETKVTDSRLAGEGRQIRRRRECLACGERFTTFETAELLMPLVVKSNRIREPFDEAKLRAGMGKALEKRPVGREDIEEAVSRIAHKLRSLGEREVSSRAIGELVMEELRQLDEVAYVRFASVYRSFQDLDAFREEIERLRHHGRRREVSRDQLSLLPGGAEPEHAHGQPADASRGPQPDPPPGQSSDAPHGPPAEAPQGRPSDPPAPARGALADALRDRAPGSGSRQAERNKK